MRIPGNSDTLAQLRQLTALNVDQDELDSLAEELKQARGLGDAVPNIKVRTVRRKLRTLKTGAEPGPSGWRNTALIAMGARPGGSEVLTRWCRMYAAGSLDAREAALLSSVCLVPLDKGGGKVRPIALGEVLAKLAQATLLDTIEKDLRRTLEPHQLSVRTPGGAEQLARTLRAWTARPGKRVLMQLDLKKRLRSDVPEQHPPGSHPPVPRPGATTCATVAARGYAGMDANRRRVGKFHEPPRRMAGQP